MGGGVFVRRFRQAFKRIIGPELHIIEILPAEHFAESECVFDKGAAFEHAEFVVIAGDIVQDGGLDAKIHRPIHQGFANNILNFTLNRLFSCANHMKKL